MMSLGNMIGSGIFLGSSTVLSVAGPAAVVAYMFGGVIMAFEVMFITEMCIVRPAAGAFRAHAAEIFGPGVGFVNGWMFWCSGVLGMASEVAAAAIFARFWFPHVPQWAFCVLFAALMMAVNLNDLKGLSRVESVLASVKVLALLIFIVFGLLMVLHVVPLSLNSGGNPFASLQSFFPHGVKGVFAAMLMVMFSYSGTGIIGLGIADTENPAKNAPAAIAVITTAVPALYALSMLFIVLLSPLNAVTSAASPFVLLLNRLHVPFSDSILNFIILTAALSGLNSSMYSSSRMLSSLGKDGQAPRIFLKNTKKGVPVFALGASSTALLLTAVLSYVIPQQVFMVLATASGFLAMINWLTVSCTHLLYRRKTLREAPEKLRFRAPGYPFTSIAEALLLLVLFATAPLYPGQVSGLVGGVALILGLIAVYFILRRARVLR